MDQDLATRLHSLCGTKRKVRITRSIPAERYLSGFVVATSEALVLLQVFHDFYPEGLSVIRASHIEHVRVGEYERFQQDILESEGIEPVPAPHPLPSLSGVEELLRDAGAHENIIVRCEDAEEALEDFYIGRVLDIDRGVMKFANFDALGRWDPDPSVIDLSEVTRVEFRSPYLEIFSRHLRDPCPHL